MSRILNQGIKFSEETNCAPEENLKSIPFGTFAERMREIGGSHPRWLIFMEAVEELARRCGKVEETRELIKLYMDGGI